MYTIERVGDPTPEGRTYQAWSFMTMNSHTDSSMILLECYQVGVIPPGKRKPVIKGSYSRISNREATIKAEPEVPAELLAEAEAYFRSRVCFSKWADHEARGKRHA